MCMHPQTNTQMPKHPEHLPTKLLGISPSHHTHRFAKLPIDKPFRKNMLSISVVRCEINSLRARFFIQSSNYLLHNFIGSASNCRLLFDTY